MSDYDVIITGLGAMGSAAAYHLAKRGKRVLGLDRFHPPHTFGSSHGATRIIREAYFEHPIYVPLVQRAYELWAELEKASGRKLLLQTGGVMIGPRDGVVFDGAKRSAEEHHLKHEILSAARLREHFPALVPTTEMAGVWEPRAGILFPELAIQTHLELAARTGADFHFNEPVLNWEPEGTGVRVRTGTASYSADRLLLSAGAWTSTLLRELSLPLFVERQILFWFEPHSRPDLFMPERCPIHLWEYDSERFFYGFPDLGDGVKVALHHQGELTTPDAVRREVSTNEVETMRQLLYRFLPEADGALRSATVCLYTNTPDQHFVLDHHPVHRQVVIASPCSGHGFKFSPAIGEVAGRLIEEEEPGFDLGLFGVRRFGGGHCWMR